MVLESAQEFVRGLFSEEKNDFQTPSVTLGFWRQTDRQTDNKATYIPEWLCTVQVINKTL